MSKKTKAKISKSSVYADLGYKNYEEMETKANLTIEIHKTIKNKKLTQTEAAEMLGITQPKLSEFLRGHFRRYSVEHLMNFLTVTK
jgi:predicted XRE-type DNA-binding protein